MPELFLSNSDIDAWSSLRSVTSARIALGRAGSSVLIKESLDFKLAHAHARDAVYSSLDMSMLIPALQPFNLPIYKLSSCAFYRQEYLQRPDLGRRLSNVSAEQLRSLEANGYDVAIILADGLSATAINKHAVPILSLLLPLLHSSGISIAPITLVEHGRVAIGDEIGALLRAKLSIIFIGERPGLTSPDSMGIYTTYQPYVGRTDDCRNCISNIRPEGLPYHEAIDKLMYLIRESLRQKISGVVLKDHSGEITD